MKRIAMTLSAALGLILLAQSARAGWGDMSYGGYQPWWNIFAHRNRMTVEEERLQRFWHDYYDALKRYYGSLDHIDWVAYYKNHGYQINTGGGMGGGYGNSGGSQRIQFAPVFVSPMMQWAVPQGTSGAMGGPPPGPSGPSGPTPYSNNFGPGPGPGPMPYGGGSPYPMPYPSPYPMPYPSPYPPGPPYSMMGN